VVAVVRDDRVDEAAVVAAFYDAVVVEAVCNCVSLSFFRVRAY